MLDEGVTGELLITIRGSQWAAGIFRLGSSLSVGLFVGFRWGSVRYMSVLGNA